MIAAKHCGMKVLGLSIVTNKVCVLCVCVFVYAMCMYLYIYHIHSFPLLLTDGCVYINVHM
ncbi:hypothetical protein EON63_18185 [archaeon]|nr:MAG: hypothetical protein EON63_18185 [archaeon]